MPQLSLAAYSVRVQNLSGKSLKFGSACGKNSLLDIFDSFLVERGVQASHDQNNKKLLRVSRKVISGQTISGIIQTGEYGYESDLYDVKLRKLSYKRRISDAEMLLFYFLVSLPKDRDRGILILQRFGQFGIRRMLGADFCAYFSNKCSDASVKMYPLTSESLIDEIVKNCRVRKVRFIKFTMRRDIADAYDRQVHEEEQGHLELAVIAKRDGSVPILGRLRQFVQGHRKMNRLIEIKDFPYDTVKVEVEFGGRRRTVDLSRFRKLRAYYDVTTQVQTGANGHPVYESIDAVASQLLSGLMEEIG